MVERSRDAAADAIRNLLDARDDGVTICPSEAARALDRSGWRGWMPVVHEAAHILVERGEAVLTQGGVAKPPEDIVGAYRIRRTPLG